MDTVFYISEKKDGFEIVSNCNAEIGTMIIPNKLLAQCIVDNLTKAWYAGLEAEKAAIRSRLGL